MLTTLTQSCVLCTLAENYRVSGVRAGAKMSGESFALCAPFLWQNSLYKNFALLFGSLHTVWMFMHVVTDE